MKKFSFVLAALLALGAGAVAHAGTITHPDAKIELTTPDGWKEEHEGDKLVVHDKDKEVVVYLEVLKAKDLKDAVDHLVDEIKDEVDDVKVEKTEEGEHHGMKCDWIHATGEHGGAKLHLFIDFIETPSHHILMVLGTIHDHNWEAHEKELLKVYEDLKPTK